MLPMIVLETDTGKHQHFYLFDVGKSVHHHTIQIN